jgi:hypothetical protein
MPKCRLTCGFVFVGCRQMGLFSALVCHICATDSRALPLGPSGLKSDGEEASRTSRTRL